MVQISFHLIIYVLLIGFLVVRIILEVLYTKPDHYVGRPFVWRYVVYIFIITLLYGGLYWW